MTYAMHPQPIVYAQTGFDRRQAGQHIFALASVAIDERQAETALADLARRVPSVAPGPTMPSKVLDTVAGRAAVVRFLEGLHHRYVVSVEDKRSRIAALVADDLLDPLFERWDRGDLAEEAKRIIEAAALDRMRERPRPADALCREMDLMTREHAFKDAPTLFRETFVNDYGVLCTLRRFLEADEEKFVAACGGRRQVALLEDRVWDALTAQAFEDHLVQWSGPCPAVSITLDGSPPMLGIATAYGDGGGVARVYSTLEGEGAPAVLVGPIVQAAPCDPRVAVARIVALAAVRVAANRYDPGEPSLVPGIERHRLRPREWPGETMPGRGGKGGSDFGDPVAILMHALRLYGERFAWGSEDRDPSNPPQVAP